MRSRSLRASIIGNPSRRALVKRRLDAAMERRLARMREAYRLLRMVPWQFGLCTADGQTMHALEARQNRQPFPCR